MDNPLNNSDYVRWFRNSSPYINAFRDRTFVVCFGGEMLADAQFAPLVHDIALLNSLGVRLVLVHGARPQIEERLKERNIELQYANGLRITNEAALQCVKEAAGSVRVEIEALLSMGVSNTPMDSADIRVVSGNYVTAQPLGVRDGVDFLHTGEVRNIDAEAVHWQLDDGAIVLFSPVGYSPTGEVFNLTAEDVATAAAIQLQADKLIYLMDSEGIEDSQQKLLRELTLSDARDLLQTNDKLPEDARKYLQSAITVCEVGIPRTHIINRHIDGAILLELFTRDGIGLLITTEQFEDTRQAQIDDVGGLLELITPLEEEGILVRRSRERIEMEIEHFTVVERDGMIVACAALYPYPDDKMAELACLVVHPDYRKQNRGDVLYNFMEKQARQQGLKKLFVLTTRTAHWFQERGFEEVDTKQLPMEKQGLYNMQRNSKVFMKKI
ncbi:MAG: amino-acid N-acetyltransferase [Gammaproteobacteria bacterium]|nr:amino-acid N-acetyltransferase [Gammaproteobacteria bacterium]